MQKPWWKSKTIIVAIIQFVVGGLTVTGTNHPELGGILMLKSALDIMLRFLSDTGIQ